MNKEENKTPENLETKLDENKDKKETTKDAVDLEMLNTLRRHQILIVKVGDMTFGSKFDGFIRDQKSNITHIRIFDFTESFQLTVPINDIIKIL